MPERGRPTDYTEGLAAHICERLASGASLRSICKPDDMPAESTVRLWALEDREGFSAHYARARELGYLSMADELVDIADDGTNDFTTRTNGDGSEVEVVDHDHIARSRLRVDTRKWLLSKMLPKVYGDKLDLNVAGTLHTMTDEAVDARITQLLGKAGAGVAPGGTGSATAAK